MNAMANDTIFPLQALAGSADVLDHAREFVDLVARRAPRIYRELLEIDRIETALAGSSGFGYGQLFVLAEYEAFRKEFDERFPDAGRSARINAFCSLFMKNDISLANLLEAAEEILEKD
jgi:hypothetical protein